MDERLLGQPSLVGIERVFLILPVKGYQALVVHTVLAALAAGICGKVKHIPHMGGPHPGARGDLADYILVILGLVLLGVIPLLGVRGVPVQRLTAVLAHAYRPIRVLLVEFVKPGAVHLGFAAVPAKVVVVGQHIGDLYIRLSGIAHTQHRYGCGAGGIHFMHQVVQCPVVLQKGGIRRAVHGDFVRQTPYHNAGVIAVLADQLRHLADGVGLAPGHMTGDIRDFCPDDHTSLVAQVIKGLAVLVMGQANGVGAQFADQIHILRVLLGGEGVADPRPILVAGYAAQGIRLAV